MKIGIGLYGKNGHQIADILEKHPDAELAAIAAYDLISLPHSQRNKDGLGNYGTLEEMLKDDRVELVSLCSPRRRDQAEDALKCLMAGKHVYAEKPCAMTEKELDAILDTACSRGLKFHEMAGTAFEQPYLSMRRHVKDGVIGEVIQVFAQKSYPYHEGRPQDNDVDGGLVMQVGIHAVRFIEHVAGIRVADVKTVATRLGNPVEHGELQMAASYVLQLENGGVACIAANYLNQPGFGKWGNEHLRIFGTKGFIESTDGGERTRLVLGDRDCGPFELPEKGKDYFDYYMDELKGRGEMPITLEEELHPLRIVIRANKTQEAAL